MFMFSIYPICVNEEVFLVDTWQYKYKSGEQSRERREREKKSDFTKKHFDREHLQSSRRKKRYQNLGEENRGVEQ